MKEEILEPFLRKMRIKRVLPYIKKYENCYMLDIGCGWNALLLKELEPYIKQGIGIDFKAPSIKTVKIETISASFEKTLPFDDEKFDVVTMLAVLEHLSYPEIILQEVQRILKPGGGLILTVPSKYAKPVLEFLSYKIHIVNPIEIADHKRYFNKLNLFAIMPEKMTIQDHYYFQFIFNNFLFAKKSF